MHQSKRKNWLCLAAAIGIGAAAQAEASNNRPPPTARKPLPVTDLRSAIDQTAAVVEGQVTDIRYEYNRRDGPWTRVILSDVRVHFGVAPPELEIRQFGGPIPEGGMLAVAELPEFAMGERYVVFLRNTAWNLSPVVGDLALRVDTVDDAEALVNPDGRAVMGVGAQGVELAPEILGASLPNEALFGSPRPDQTQPATNRSTPKALGQGAAAVAVVESTSAQNREPLDRESFMVALDAILERLATNVSGTFYDRPAGEFKWYAMQTVRPAGEEAADDAAETSFGPQVDTSGPERE